MKRWSSFVFLLLFVSSGQAVAFTVAAENICTECSVSVKQLINTLGLSLDPQHEKKRVAIVLSNNLTLGKREAIAINQIAGPMEKVNFGNRLIQKSNESKAITYRLFYQIGIDQRGSTSLGNAQGLPTFELDRQDPHELWGFFKTINGQGYVLLNEYQRPGHALFSLTHELMHLFDDKTRLYVERQKKLGPWNVLDQMAVEFRALLAETLIYAQLKKTSMAEILAGNEVHKKFVDRNGEIKLKELSEYLLETFYPTHATPTLELAASQDESAFDVSGSWSGGYKKLGWALPIEIIKNGILETLSFFLGESIKRCSPANCPILSVVLLNYQESDSVNLESWAAEQRMKISQELRARGASHLLQYFEMSDLISDVQQGISLRESGINDYVHSPRPRLNGGTLKSSDRVAPRTNLGIKIDSSEAIASAMKKKGDLAIPQGFELNDPALNRHFPKARFEPTPIDFNK